MSSHPRRHGQTRGPAGRGRNRAALRQLGWPHYWLLVSILASGLAFFVLILVMHGAGDR